MNNEIEQLLCSLYEENLMMKIELLTIALHYQVTSPSHLRNTLLQELNYLVETAFEAHIELPVNLMCVLQTILN